MTLAVVKSGDKKSDTSESISVLNVVKGKTLQEKEGTTAQTINLFDRRENIVNLSIKKYNELVYFDRLKKNTKKRLFSMEEKKEFISILYGCLFYRKNLLNKFKLPQKEYKKYKKTHKKELKEVSQNVDLGKFYDLRDKLLEEILEVTNKYNEATMSLLKVK